MMVNSLNGYSTYTVYTVKSKQQDNSAFLNIDQKDNSKTDPNNQESRIDSKDEKDQKNNKTDPQKLTDEQKQVLMKLQARDTEVRAHEAAHQAAGGGLTGGANFSYERGPDGRMYAVGGEVGISIPSPKDPKDRIQVAQQVIAAAMAPANPSPQDYKVAANARNMMIKAQQDLAKQIYKNESDQLNGVSNNINTNNTDSSSSDQDNSSKNITDSIDIVA